MLKQKLKESKIKNMARLMSYKKRDENRYSTFADETSNNSSENLTESNRIRLLSKIKTKSRKPTNRTKHAMPDTIPTISANIELHRNKISQSRTINGVGVTQGRRRPRSVQRQSRDFASKCCAKKCGNAIGCCWWKWCCRRKCWSAICCGGIDYDDSENDDDDIDAKFEQYKYEMRLNELKRAGCDNTVCNDVQQKQHETNFQPNSYQTETVSIHASHQTGNNSMATNGNEINDGNASTRKTASKLFRYRKYWNWNTNDSLRSNSDNFLETLEYDMDGEQSLNRENNKYKPTDISARIKGYTGFALRFFSLLFAPYYVCTSSK